MKKRIIAFVLAALLLMAEVPDALAKTTKKPTQKPAKKTQATKKPTKKTTKKPTAKPKTLEEIMGIDKEYPKTMYVYTDNGGPLNVRSEPNSNKSNVIGQLQYGDKVTVESPVVINPEWSVITYKKGKQGVGYVMTRYLVNSKPKDTEKRLQERRDKEELNRQIKTEKAVRNPYYVAVRTTRTSGWVNFRKGPGVAAERIASLPDGRILKVIGETTSWYKAQDQETKKTGYISKSYTVAVAKPSAATATPKRKTATPKPIKKTATATPKPVKKTAKPTAKPTVKPTVAATAAPTLAPENIILSKEQMGKLSVNGEFMLQCQLPEGYTMQLINAMGTKITAFITSEDKEKPILQLSVAFDDLYADVKRMNDMSEDDLKVLEESFTDMNEVDISYKETAYGTKLLIAREVGDDADFVDILSVCEGYFIEFVMSPNPEAKDQKLTDEQIQMCIDFLSELDFVEVK